MKNNKEFKNLEEQIEIFKSKGLVVNNIDYAKEVLLRENYFFLNGYRHLFMKSNSDKTYVNGATFEELYSLFLFDRAFRNLLFKNILTIENNLKSIISYQLSLRYGYREKDYLNPKNFTNNPEKHKQVNDVIKKMKRQIKNNATQHSATMHYVTNYGYIPLWVLVKVISFGILGELYSILKKEDQIIIADIYNIDVDVFENYIVMVSNYRNLCAHEDIVFENKTQRQIEDTKFHRELKIDVDQEDKYIYGKNDVFALVLIIKQMLKDDEFNAFCNELSNLINDLGNTLKSIPIDNVLQRMGFPKNWEDLRKLSTKKVFESEE